MKKVLVKFNFSDIKHGLIVPNFCVIQEGNEATRHDPDHAVHGLLR